MSLERKLPDLALQPEPDIQIFDSSSCRDDEFEFFVYVDGVREAFIKCRKRFLLDTERLVDFAVVLWCEDDDGEMAEICRADTAHGFIHTHTPDGVDHDTSEVPADCRRNVDRAYDWALDYCWEKVGRL